MGLVARSKSTREGSTWHIQDQAPDLDRIPCGQVGESPMTHEAAPSSEKVSV